VSDPQPPERPPPPEGTPEDTQPPETPQAPQPPDTPPPSEGGPEAPEPPETPEAADRPPEGTAPGAAPFAYEPPPPHPVRLVVFDDLKRSRLTVFFRLLLLIPHTAWQNLWALFIGFLVIVNWFAVLVRARPPEDLHLLLARALRYWTHVTSYTYLVSNPYPTFFGRLGTHPVDLEVEGPERQRRVITFFRLILAIPAFVIAYVFIYVMLVVAFIGWFIALVVGRMPKGMRDLSAYCLQYQAQTGAYLMILADRYPSFSGPRS
jgi:Domain of unknown function (DUF4389)